jgi:hypothetical protein
MEGVVSTQVRSFGVSEDSRRVSVRSRSCSVNIATHVTPNRAATYQGEIDPSLISVSRSTLLSCVPDETYLDCRR